MNDAKTYFKKLGNKFVQTNAEFIKLIPVCPQFTKEQIKIIYKALYKATELHKNQKRKSGEAYITHPIAVASILANFGFDYETVTAALLHDTVEDTNYSLSECEIEFGPIIARLVDGVTKIGNDVNNETHNKILMSSQEDPRIIAIKAADRLHNMYTLDVLKESKQIEIATETKEFYVPITKILGIYQLKDEFQDLCLYYLDRESFFRIYELREVLKTKNNNLELLGSKTQSILSMQGIPMTYNYRVKNIGGIYEEMYDSNLDDIEDLFAIKMVLDDRLMCYETLGAVHSIAKPINGSFKDYIAIPKNNGYKSLNTNVTFNDSDVQVRIRTKDMQKTNNLGVFKDLNEDVKTRLSNDMRKKLTNLSTSK